MLSFQQFLRPLHTYLFIPLHFLSLLVIQTGPSKKCANLSWLISLVELIS